MRLVIQRVHHSRLYIDSNLTTEIGVGLVVLIGFGLVDECSLPNNNICLLFVEKLATLRIFPNKEGKFAHSLEDINGELLLVPQFTLYGDCHKGRRPSFHLAASGKVAKQFFITFYEQLCIRLPGKVQKGVFGADMDVYFENWGPVTILIDSEEYTS
ncbi:D-tyrosyl-tRNA(Tyr) deacylase [Lawsonia intracellularis]|uniref:D-tyrosyl-tRNA(Tyr) deacylase n=1 Tax=Lawsonia intracellularis (strain PHE/MN1-00) TaxID=363253 RepID=Q1MR77_LAWIP|nr:D-aminoacyl-tRNA deacylase [Lawsonia intracellularis]AGC49859.1 D-tyrosyl-tRNA(Tyr) deacylase [Lawsonia intracellularis N343]KAA0205361.1 D-tyrosyl-tRNA(Tyr) deacylase [Lawsonia intracellularis]MBZ3892103.1 D-tyrosyl-tRNA(Tyr) deacylase [Lawsonia intracellularis]OMQ04624.1 D-tyrosyl-tRNA(Tyr) deacylase [Lawsonia intracellularis]RBN32092.1 D-tyrosyl-tRNA(Tyr) deacylase [Lawsonia intracellularis]